MVPKPPWAIWLCIRKYVLNKLADPLIYSLTQGKPQLWDLCGPRDGVLSLELEAIAHVYCLAHDFLVKMHLSFIHFIPSKKEDHTSPQENL